MLYLCYLCRFKPLRDHLRGFLIAAWAGDKIAEFSFPEISFHFPLRPWFFFVSPAYAGKRARPKTPPLTPRDHPRMCGEKSVPGSAQSPAMGSPPHVRGKGVSTGFARAYPRITPAYAGKRADAGWIWSRPPDHPRVCGEKVWALVRAVMALGSPPHVRGKVHLTGAVVVGGGITPAYAGKRHTYW